MNTKKIDLVNIFLIFISLWVAFKLPFELFLFSYAVLGPLHYVTEINWLHEKKYFVIEKKWIVVLFLLSVLVSVPAFLKLPFFNTLNEYPMIHSIGDYLKKAYNQAVLSTLFFAIGLIYLKKWQAILLSFFGSVLLAFLLLKYISFTNIITGVFIPTIVHVYIFTLLFMIYGTLQSKSKAGVIAIIFLIASPIIIIMSKINPNHYVMSDATINNYLASGFTLLNINISKILSLHSGSEFFLLSINGIKIQIFIAFCYTYHYLNWFSKTSIIGWHRNVSKRKLTLVIVVWLLSVIIYWYDYKIGLATLFFLSILHVLLEFPLNITSIKGIISKIKIQS